MASVRDEAVLEVLGRASDLQILCEPFGELFWREGLVFDAFGVWVDRR
jgi:hypothetical protein